MTIVELVTAISLAFASADTIQCYEDPVPYIVNPGQGYAVQYYWPFQSQLPAYVRAFGIFNNDANTVWPSAGIIIIQPDSIGEYRFPLPTELQTLQRETIPAVADTAILRFDMWTDRVEPQVNDAVVAVLEVPPGALMAVGDGPGFAAGDKQPWHGCSFFTLDGGQTWLEPNDYTWAWAIELQSADPVDVPFEPSTWSRVKRLYR